MHRYKNTHLWLLIPFFITLFGFSRYWLGFTDAPLEWHLHGLSAVGWYLVLLAQPWVVNNLSVAQHRKLGMIGIMIAGAVVASTLNVISGNLDINSGPRVALKYSTSLAELITVAGFAFSVIAAIFNAKNVDKHAQWMISTVFWVLPPATTRLAFLIAIGIFGSPENFPFHPFILGALNVLILVIILAYLIIRYYRKFKLWAVPYIVVGVFTLLRIFIMFGLKDAAWVKGFIEAIFG